MKKPWTSSQQDTGSWHLISLSFSLALFFFSFFPSIFTSLTVHPTGQLDLPHHRPKPLYVPVTRNNESTFCTRDQYLAPRVAFITWLVTFFLEKKYVSSAAVAQSAKNGTEVIPKLIQVSMPVPFCWILTLLWKYFCSKTPERKNLWKDAKRKYSNQFIIN